MNYYKILVDNKIVNVSDSSHFRRFQQKHSLLLYSQKDKAQYLQINDILFYHDWWMTPVTTDKIDYQLASIIEISEEEYNELYEILKEGKEIYLPEEIEEPVVEFVEDNRDTENIKNSKLSELSLFCRKNIQSGFDIILSDGEVYHFSLEITDQLNISNLYNRALTQETFLPYHADGKIYQIFSSTDVFAIYRKMEETINYHSIYYNSLKNYVNSLQNIEEIRNIKYGIEIPLEYQSEVLKNLIGK